MYTCIYIPKVYTILLSRDLKNPNVGFHPPTHLPNKKSLRDESERLIKYMRIRWTPSGKASLIPPRGIKSNGMELEWKWIGKISTVKVTVQ